MDDSRVLNIVLKLRDEATAQMSGMKGVLQGMSSGFNEAAQASEKFAGVMAIGAGLVTTGLVGAATAAWNQVDAVQSATFALRAYSTSATETNGILSQLIAYARSPLGTLFQRQDLFQAAQTLMGFGDTAKQVVSHVETLSKGVALGYTNFADLSMILGRVQQAGFLDATSFDELAYRGIVLNSSLRSTKITTDQLYNALNKALPDKLLEGRAQTIQGRLIQLQSAFRDLGSDILGVDTKTSSFIKGGLGDTIVQSITRLKDALKDPAIATTLKEMGAGIAKLIDAVSKTINVQNIEKFFTFIKDNGPIVAGIIVGGLLPSILNFIKDVAFATGKLSGWMAFASIVFLIMQNWGPITTFFEGKFGPLIQLFQNFQTRVKQILQSFGISGEFGGLTNWFTSTSEKVSFYSQRVLQLVGGFMQEVKNKLAGQDAKSGNASWVDALVGAYNRIKPLIEAFKSAIEPAMKQFETAGAVIKTQLIPSWNALMQVLRPFITALGPQFRDLFQKMAVAIGAVAGAIIVLATALLAGLVRAVADAAPYIIQSLAGLIQAWRGIIQFLTGVFTGNWKLAWEGIKQTVKGAYDYITNAFNALTHFISGFIQGVIGFFWDLYNALIGHSIIPDLVNGIVSYFNVLKDSIFNIWTNIKNSVISIATDMWNGLKGILNNMIQGVNTLIGGLNSVGGKIGLGSVKIASIPMLANGTNFFEGGTAIVGENGPELVNLPRGSQVVPNHKISNYDQSSIQIGPVYVNNQSDVNMLAQRLAFVKRTRGRY